MLFLVRDVVIQRLYKGKSEAELARPHRSMFSPFGNMVRILKTLKDTSHFLVHLYEYLNMHIATALSVISDTCSDQCNHGNSSNHIPNPSFRGSTDPLYGQWISTGCKPTELSSDVNLQIWPRNDTSYASHWPSE